MGYSVFMQSGGSVGTPVTSALRFRIDYNGNVGLGVATPSYPVHSATGAYLSGGGVWTDASSRDYKENIGELTSEQALAALRELTPVTYNYKADAGERHVGFIAEDVPELVASVDRKGISPMDIVAVLTKAVQEQQRVILEQEKAITELRDEVRGLKSGIREQAATLTSA
jgi:hypothetical protein